MPEPSSSPHDASGLPPADDRTPEARERLQGHLRASYGVRTVEEELLLERVVDLTWRLRGTALALGAKATLGRLDAARYAMAPRLPTPSNLADLPQLDSLDPAVLRDALARVQDLALDMEDPRSRPSWLDTGNILNRIVGVDRVVHGLDGFAPLREVHQWQLWEEGLAEDAEEVARTGVPFPEDPDAPVKPEHTWSDVLGDLARRLEARLSETLAMQVIRRAARTEMGEVPTEDDVKVFPRYERDLARQLEQATKALREAVGRRRLGEIGRAWLRGR